MEHKLSDLEKQSVANEVKEIFKENMKTQRLFEEKVMKMSKKDFENNKDELSNCVEKIVKQMEA